MPDVALIVGGGFLEDPYNGTEPLILVGGGWFHPDCAEQAARAATPAPERKARPEPEAKAVPSWLPGIVLIGCVASHPMRVSQVPAGLTSIPA